MFFSAITPHDGPIVLVTPAFQNEVAGAPPVVRVRSITTANNTLVSTCGGTMQWPVQTHGTQTQAELH